MLSQHAAAVDWDKSRFQTFWAPFSSNSFSYLPLWRAPRALSLGTNPVCKRFYNEISVFLAC